MYNFEDNVYFKNRLELRASLNNVVKRRLGNGIFISNKEQIGDKKADIILGMYVPKVIDDSKTNERIVKMLKFESLGLLEIKKEDQGFNVLFPKPDEIHQRLVSKISKMVFGIESTLLETTYDKLVKIPIIQTSLNPIREIVVDIYRNGETKLDSFKKERGDKAERYISFLEGLSLIKKDNNTIKAGSRFNDVKGTIKGDESVFFNFLLADVLKNGYGYIKEYLKLTSITPYIRWSNAYYLPSSQVSDLLLFNQDAMMESHENIYNIKTTERKALNQISRLADADILKEEDRYYIGHADILKNTISTVNKLT